VIFSNGTLLIKTSEARNQLSSARLSRVADSAD